MGERADARLVIGVGCTRGAPLPLLEQSIERLLHDHDLSPLAICTLATLDRKSDEPAIVELARARGWNVVFFSSEELERAATRGSEVVRGHVATPAVAEPAARLAGGELRVEKTVYRDSGSAHAVTLAVATQRNAP